MLNCEHSEQFKDGVSEGGRVGRTEVSVGGDFAGFFSRKDI